MMVSVFLRRQGYELDGNWRTCPWFERLLGELQVEPWRKELDTADICQRTRFLTFMADRLIRYKCAPVHD